LEASNSHKKQKFLMPLITFNVAEGKISYIKSLDYF